MNEQDRFKQVQKKQQTTNKPNGGDGIAVVITILLLLAMVAGANKTNQGIESDTLTTKTDGTAMRDTVPAGQKNTVAFDSLDIIKTYNSKQK